MPNKSKSKSKTGISQFLTHTSKLNLIALIIIIISIPFVIYAIISTSFDNRPRAAVPISPPFTPPSPTRRPNPTPYSDPVRNLPPNITSKVLTATVNGNTYTAYVEGSDRNSNENLKITAANPSSVSGPVKIGLCVTMNPSTGGTTIRCPITGTFSLKTLNIVHLTITDTKGLQTKRSLMIRPNSSPKPINKP